uniref:Translational initiation factor n=1 Tax=Arachis pintoi TaxID=108216 RepID=A0A8F9WL98_9FABA|nr:Translational initiation factor [Arachis pintoi]
MFGVHLFSILNNENISLDYISEKVQHTLYIYFYHREKKNASLNSLIRLFFNFNIIGFEGYD